MRSSWIFGGAVLILLSIIFIYLNLSFLWITPQIVFVVGIIILFIGLIIPEVRDEVVVNRPPEVVHHDVRDEPAHYETRSEREPVVQRDIRSEKVVHVDHDVHHHDEDEPHVVEEKKEIHDDEEEY